MRKRQLLQRPYNFRLKSDHSLAQGVMFAGLENSPGSIIFYDSSVYNNHSIFINISPIQAWIFDTKIQRTAFTFGPLTLSAGIDTTVPIVSIDATLAIWYKGLTNAGFPVILGTCTGGYDDFRCIIRQLNTGSMRAYVLDGGSVLRNVEFTGYDLTKLQHYCLVSSGTALYVYLNGVLVNQTEKNAGITNSSLFGIGKQAGRNDCYSHYMTGVDALYYNRALNISEIQQLADPSNVMLSGMLEPPKRKFYTGISRQLIAPRKYQYMIAGVGISYTR